MVHEASIVWVILVSLCSLQAIPKSMSDFGGMLEASHTTNDMRKVKSEQSLRRVAHWLVVIF